MEPHAVRWARRKVRNEYQYSQWHWTEELMWTLCGVMVSIGDEGTFLPETYDDMDAVTCKHCRRLLALD